MKSQNSLRQSRLQRRLTARQMAERSGYSVKTIYTWERLPYLPVQAFLVYKRVLAASSSKGGRK